MDTETLILILVFTGMVFFVLVGMELFGRGWDSYEERYVRGAEKTLNAMYVTIPAEHLLYLSLASFVLVSMLFTLLTGYFFVGVVLGLCAFSFPRIAINILKHRRDLKFGLQLVDALSSMGNALKAGLSLPQSLEIIHQEMDNPIRQEFRLLTQELRFGVRMEDAFNRLQSRMPNPDLALVSTAITISQEVGGNLSEVFDNISKTIRERSRLESRIKALTAQGKLQGIILCLLPVVLGAFLSVFYPEMMRPLFETAAGWGIIVVSVLLLLIGGYFISRIIAIEV